MGHGAPSARLVSAFSLALALVVVGCGSTTHRGTLAAQTPVRVKDQKGFHCLKSNLDSLGRCPDNQNFGKTRAQVRALALAKAKAARRAAIARAKAARLAAIAKAKAAERARI